MPCDSPGPPGHPDTNHCQHQCLDKQFPASKRTVRMSGGVILLHISLLFLLCTHVSLVSGEGLCDPLLCTCALTSANCSYRGFLNLPSGLQQDLKSLDISNNDIQEVNQTELYYYPDIEYLDLSKNRLTAFDGGKKSKLLRLDLSHNDILTLRRITVSHLKQLKYLDLSYNKITSVPSKIFPSKSKLEILNLASNNIELLEPRCFAQLENLQELKLNRNKLSSLPKLTFYQLEKLELLELNKNKLEKIPGLTFHGLKNVKILKLRKNNLRYLDDGAFWGLDSIQQLYLDRNQVVSVTKGWLYGLVTLEVLSLSFNEIDFIDDDGWEFCKEVYNLNLQGNQIEIVERNILRRLPSLKSLNLKDNLISHIDATDSFAEVPDLEELYLDGNQLSHTIEDTSIPFKHLTKLKVLGLARNNIKSVGNLALAGLESLETVDLSDNVISTIQESPVNDSPHLSQLYLNSSSLLCDCHLRWFAEYVNSSHIVGVTGTCAHPESLKDHLVTSVHSDSFTCEDFPKPYFQVEPQSQIALRGKELSLNCRAASTSPAKMTFVWKKDDTILELRECSNSYNCIENTEHSFDGKGMEVTSELRLVNLSHHDIGSYQCIVHNVYGATYSTKADITVYVFPQFELTPEAETVQGGSSVTLKCSASGYPQPKISWQKDSGSDFPAARERRIKVDPETNTYVITAVKAEDMGVYTCTATNLAGSISTNVSINVLEVPRFVKPMLNKTVSLGETAVLECQASGAPRPSLMWTHNSDQLVTTHRHFLTADNQLLIIVKVERGDRGQYQCVMHNDLGTVSGTSYLSVAGADSGAHGQGATTSTGVIVIAVVSCVLGTSAVWLVIICYTRHRSQVRRREWEDVLDAKDVETPSTGMPLLGHNTKDDDTGSERDSGTGDSKKSGDNDTIVDTVIHNFLAARGESVTAQWINTTSLSDFDTGISSMADSSAVMPTSHTHRSNGAMSASHSHHSLHRRGCPKAVTGQQKAGPQTPAPVVSSISYAVDNPLYDSLPGQQHTTASTEETASLISDSVAYCGRWPGRDGGLCDQCGECLATCAHGDNVSSVSSSGQTANTATTDQPITFNTFHPLQQSNTNTNTNTSSSSKGGKNKKKRLSAVETPEGETFLQIDTAVVGEGRSRVDMTSVCAAQLEQDTAAIMAAKEYRGGGTLPRHGGLQQEWLEASLNYAEAENRQREARKRRVEKRRSMFRHRSHDRSERRQRRRSTGSGSVAGSSVTNDEHSSVGSKATDMF